MAIIIALYFTVNIFCSGYYFGIKLERTKSLTDFFSLMFWCLGSFLVASIWILVSLLFALIEIFFGYLNRTIQFKFWFEFFLTKKYDKVSILDLERLNKKAVEKQKSNKIGDKSYLFGLKLINKKNNYIPSN